MARGRDLAGLAALAGLAYMANRKDKEEPQNLGADSGAAIGAISPEDARGNAEMARMAALDNPDFEPGMYTKEPGGDSAPAPARAAPTRSVAKATAAAPARPNIVSREEGMKSYVPRRTPTREEFKKGVMEYIGRTSNAKAQAPAQAAAASKPKPKALSMSDELNPTEPVRNPRTGRPYKKGGAVKKMASGGMTSASKRADGIASRGKTKCKMY